MKTISSNLKNDILNGVICNLIKISLVKDGVLSGVKYCYTDHDEAITVSGDTFTPAPGLQKINFISTAHPEVSNQTFGSAWVDAPKEDLMAGVFDSAWMEVSWASWKNPGYGKLITFLGQLGEINWSENGFHADIVSTIKNLSSNIGQIYTGSCRHELFSGTAQPIGKIGACGLSAASYKVTGSISSVTTAKWKFVVNLPSGADGFFSNGIVKFTSGSNSGLSYVVKIHKLTTGVHTFELMLPTAFVANPSDTFEVLAGCDKTFATCQSKFNNAINFGGFPHIRPQVTTQ